MKYVNYRKISKSNITFRDSSGKIFFQNPNSYEIKRKNGPDVFYRHPNGGGWVNELCNIDECCIVTSDCWLDLTGEVENSYFYNTQLILRDKEGINHNHELIRNIKFINSRIDSKSYITITSNSFNSYIKDTALICYEFWAKGEIYLNDISSNECYDINISNSYLSNLVINNDLILKKIHLSKNKIIKPYDPTLSFKI